MKRHFHKASAALLLLSGLAVGAAGMAAKPENPGGGGHKPPTGDAASNNLSYPVIWSDGVVKPGFVQSTALAFAQVYTDGAGRYYTLVGESQVDCVGENDIVPPEKIDPNVLCYYGRLNLGISEETGERIFVGDPKVWWLQQRQPHNLWQAFNVDVDPATTGPVVVTGVDTGDLLESSTVIKNKQVRTEFTLLKYVATDDAQFGAYVLDPFDGTLTEDSFQAFGMSGAVPGTDQSIAETQGNDFGPGANGVPGTQTMLDPTTIKVATNYFDPDAVAPEGDAGTEAEEPGDPRIVPLDPPLGMHATVYSACARLMIQKVTGDDILWSSEEGRWVGTIGGPVVNVAAYNATTDVYSAEINAGGGVIYGYNWNTKANADGAGTYRVTFLLDGPTSEGGRCTAPMNTVFDDTSMSVNVGERRPATLIPGTDEMFTAGEGGLVYVDVEIGAGGGGGKTK